MAALRSAHVRTGLRPIRSSNGGEAMTIWCGSSRPVVCGGRPWRLASPCGILRQKRPQSPGQTSRRPRAVIMGVYWLSGAKAGRLRGVNKKDSPDVHALLAEAQKKRPGIRCGVRLALESLPPDVAAVLVEALNDEETYSQNGLSDVFKAYGYPVQEFTVGNHRRKKCACDRSSATA